MILLLLALAGAQEPVNPTDAAATTVPASPRRPPDQDGDCTSKAGAPAGATRPCAAVSVPPSYLAYLEARRVYSDQLLVHLTAANAAAEYDAAACAATIEDLRAAPPLLQRPGVQLAIGVVAGVGVTVGAGWALGQVTPAQ